MDRSIEGERDRGRNGGKEKERDGGHMGEGRDFKQGGMEGWLAHSTLVGSFGASINLNTIRLQQLLTERAGDDIQVR